MVVERGGFWFCSGDDVAIDDGGKSLVKMEARVSDLGEG